MMCPFCQSENHVVYSNKKREEMNGSTVRYRKCNNCGLTFKTREIYSRKTLEEAEEYKNGTE